jgi:hypothetical protein
MLGALVTLPALVVQIGLEQGRVAFVLYREPKLVVIMILGWTMLAALVLLRPNGLRVDTLATSAHRTESLLLVVLLGYLSLSLLWTQVPQNGMYELSQFLMLSLLAIFLLAWDRADGRVRRVVHIGLVCSLAIVTVVGLLQALGVVHLIPIDPSDVVAHPSLMGYKNPAALAVLGQLFLLAELVTAPSRKRRATPRVLLWLVLIVELGYLLSLQSRTAYLGLVVGTLFLVLIITLGTRRRMEICLLAILIVGALSTAALMHPASRGRLSSTLDYLVHPARYLESDRGTYLLNTVNMARDRPLGVGLGDWQTQYPVYRLHNRHLWFSERHQVRRAHSDHVQMLGEVGWPGLALWLAFLAAVIVQTARHGVSNGSRSSVFSAAQLVAMAAAMSTDYVIETPYGKFQLFLIVFLCISSTASSGSPKSSKRVPGILNWSLSVVVAAVAVSSIWYYGCLARKIQQTTRATQLYLRATAASSSESDLQPGLDRHVDLRRAVRLADLADGVPGHTKTMFRFYFAGADARHRVGDRRRAIDYLTRSLELHPHHPNSFRLMSSMTGDPDVARAWREGANYVMYVAAHGYRRPYPLGHPFAKAE